MTALTKEKRDALPAHMFAVPKKRQLPLHDERHVRMSETQINHTKGLTEEEKSAAKTHILKRAHELGINTKDWQLHAVTFTIEAMSLAMPDDPSHPNRMPFSGILTRVNEASDEPPGGATGKCVYIPARVAEAALNTLMGMGVDCTRDFSGHDAQFKIGVITEATVSGNAVHIAGFLYRDDFPEECARIKKEKSLLGFSYECKVAISDENADPWVVDRIIFTGAAILYKDRAAYHTTSLAAVAAQKDDAMTPEELKKLNDTLAALSASIATITTDVASLKAGKGASLAGPIIDQAMPHVGACNACADGMEAAGIGTHPTMGHAAIIRKVGAHILHGATMGKLPHIFNDHGYIEAAEQPDKATKEALDKATADLKAATDAISSLNTQIADLKADQSKQTENAGAPHRKTMTAAGTAFLHKFGIKAGEDGSPADVDTVDAALMAAGVTGRNAIAAKLRMKSAGAL